MSKENQPSASTKPPLVVNAQYIKDFSFENPNAPQVLMEAKEAPAVQINVDVKATRMGESVFEVALMINAEAKSGGKTAFVIELSYGGLFTLTGIPEDQIQPVLLIECPRLLFPFARSIIGDATREGGYAPLLIHPIDFAGLYLRQKQTETQQAAAGGNTGT